MATKAVVKSTKSTKSTALQTTSFTQDLEDLRSRIAAPTGDKIKLENKRFKMPNGDSLDYLDVVIVDFVYSNRYYTTGYEKDNIVAPDCFSINPLEKELSPSPNSPDIQCQTGCASCPKNQYGSKGKGKACSNRIVMAVLPQDAGPETPFVILDIPPTSIKGFAQYVNSIARGLQRPPFGVVTHIEQDPSETYAKCVFSDPQVIEDGEFIALLRSRREEARERLLVEPDVTAMQAANDAKPSKLKAPVKRRA
jgi:hypothetical protein